MLESPSSLELGEIQVTTFESLNLKTTQCICFARENKYSKRNIPFHNLIRGFELLVHRLHPTASEFIVVIESQCTQCRERYPLINGVSCKYPTALLGEVVTRNAIHGQRDV